MGFVTLGLGGLILWFASMQYQAVPRRMMLLAAVGAGGYGAWLFLYRPEEAWAIRWMGQAIADAVFRLLLLIPP